VTFPFAEGFDDVIGDTDVVNVVNGVVNSVVNDIVDKILAAFKNNSRETIKEIAEMAGVTSRTIDREVEALKAAGKLKRVGSPRFGHWEVCE